MPLIASLTTGVTALKAFSRGMEVVGDNIANVNTTAFKGGRATYSDNFGDVLQRSSGSPAGGNGSDVITMQVGQGVHVGSIKSDFGQGTLNSTGAEADFGISGNGFFRVRDVRNQSDFVTRAGDFRIDDQGYLVTTGGLRVQGLNDGAAQFEATVVGGSLVYTPVTVTPPTTVGDVQITSNMSVVGGGLVNNTGGLFTDAEIEASAPKIVGFAASADGDLSLRLSNGESYVRGTILLQDFQDSNALVREAGNLFSALLTAKPIGGLALSAANRPNTAGNGALQQGVLEQSNVDLTEEFAELINTQRSFQAGSRVITTADQVLEEIVNLKR